MKPSVALLAVMHTIEAAAVASQSKPTTTSALSITAPTTRAAVSTDTSPGSTVDIESLLSGPPTHCTSSLGRDSPACTDWLDIVISLDLLTNLTDRWAAPNTPKWILEMVDEVNVNAGDADISAHTDDEAEMESMLALYTAEGKEHTVELL